MASSCTWPRRTWRPPAALDGVVERLRAAGPAAGVRLLIEGPVDSLDGGDFDVTRDSDADAAGGRAAGRLAKRIGARAVNIHLIAPSADTARLTLECRAGAARQSACRFCAHFVEQITHAGAMPTVENMPPVLRMRRSDFAFTPIGMAPRT